MIYCLDGVRIVKSDFITVINKFLIRNLILHDKCQVYISTSSESSIFFQAALIHIANGQLEVSLAKN